MNKPAEPLRQISDGLLAPEAQNSEALLRLLYDELRHLATAKMAREAPGQTLQPTALVHEAWLRLLQGQAQNWQNRAHFFAAAAEAMRRILVERARRRKVLARGGFAARTELSDSNLLFSEPDDELLAVHEALDGLGAEDVQATQLVKLRYFAGMSMPEAAAALNLPLRSAERVWTFARAWLRQALRP